jgi:S1-C subfamily serine protease
MALRVMHVGQYGEHAAAKNAGFLKDDIIVAFDGHTERMTETDLLAYTLQQKLPGDVVKVAVQRGGQRQEFTLRLQ